MKDIARTPTKIFLSKIMKDFWQSKKVLITGATGFIGSWLTEALLEKGADITVLVNKNDCFGEEAIKHLRKNIKIVYGDIKNKELIEKIVKNKEILFHLAAITQVLYSIKNPAETMAVNSGGTLNILEAIKKENSNQFLVYVSTDKVYGEPKYLPLDENHPLSAKSPYDASKVSADRSVSVFNQAFGVKATILRWANTYGGRDANLLRAVPDFLTSIIDNRPLVIRGDGEHIRDFLYVSDVVNALLLAGEKQSLSNGQVFNLGTTKQTSIKKLADLVIKISDYKEKPII